MKTEALHELMQTGKLYKRTKGQVIQTTENEKAFYLVKSGYIKRYMISNSGSLGVQVIYGPGDFFSITQVFKVMFGRDVTDSPEIFYYEAVNSAEIYAMPIDDLLAKAKTNQLLYRDFFLVSGNRLHSTLHGLENMTMKNSYKRVAHHLYYFAKRFGERKTDGTKISLPLTHQDIADMLSLTRETVSMNMVQLRNNKLIKTGRLIVVPDMEKLQEEAYG